MTTSIKKEKVIGEDYAHGATLIMMERCVVGTFLQINLANGMKTEGEFYPNDVALLLINNESGSEVFVEVKVINRFNEYGRVRYLIEPVAGKGQMKVEKLEKIKK